MPTENRSCNTEMVSVQRELLERCCMRPRLETRAVNHQDIIDRGRAQAELREILAQPAKHQGEPVALPERKGLHLRYDTLMPTFSKDWNACLDEIAKLGPLYTRPATAEQQDPVAYRQRFICQEEGPSSWELTESSILAGRPGWEVVPLYAHADHGEVERMRAELDKVKENSKHLAELDDAFIKSQGEKLRAMTAQLAERDALLTDISKRHRSGVDFDLPADLVDRIKALSASAEPSAPVERDERALPGWLTIDAERVTVRLSRPSEANGVQVDSLSLRAPTVRDICNATVGGAGDDAQSELILFASLAEVGVKDLEGLALKDYSRLQTGYFRLVQDDFRAALECKQ